MKTFVAAIVICLLSASHLDAVEKKDLLGKWIGMKGESRWQIERFEDGTYKLKFRSSNVIDDAVNVEGKWEIKAGEYRYNWLKSDGPDFEPDEEMIPEKVHSFDGRVFTSVDRPENRQAELDYFNMEIKVEKFPDFDLTKVK